MVVEGVIEAVGVVCVGGGGFIVFGVVAIAPIVDGVVFAGEELKYCANFTSLKIPKEIFTT